MRTDKNMLNRLSGKLKADGRRKMAEVRGVKNDNVNDNDNQQLMLNVQC